MLTNAKINLKKYIAFSVVLFILELTMARNSNEIIGMSVIFAAACLNQFLLVKVVRAMTLSAVGVPVKKSQMITMSLGKVFLLVAALIYGVHLMGDRVIIPLLIYVLQIAVLYLSFDRKKSEN